MSRAVCTLLCLLAASCATAGTGSPSAPSTAVAPAPSAAREAAPAASAAPAAPAATAAPATPAAAGVKTIILLRHAEAEKGPHGGDPPLTAEGRARAVELARTLADVPLRTVYSTRFQRGRQTAAQLPGRPAGEPTTVVDDVPGTLRALAGEPWGATLLVVGHSNTLSDLIRGLTGHALPESEPIVFDRIWIVTLTPDGASAMLRMRYGAPVAVTR